MLATVVWSGVPAAAAAPAVAPGQPLVTLLRDHRVFAWPAPNADRVDVVPARAPLTGGPTVLPVLGERSSGGGRDWFQVLLPGRPNGRRGWIGTADTVASTTRWHVVVDLARRSTTVYEDGRAVRSAPAVVGTPGTPTPVGEFFVEEVIELPASAVGAPYAFALSARSTVLQEFDGGPGQIALHGRAHIGGVLGTAASHGCVRLDDETLRWLVVRLGPGTPVTIHS